MKTFQEFKEAIKGFKDGEKVRCSIQGTVIEDAELQIINEDEYFILQNEEDGRDSADKRGYKYSWAVREKMDGHYNVEFIKKTKSSEQSPKYKGIPQHLIDQGVRWVMTSNYRDEKYAKRLLISELPEGAVDKFICVLEKDSDLFLSGEGYCWNCWAYLKEIEDTKKIPFTYETFPKKPAVWIRTKSNTQERVLVTGVGHSVVSFCGGTIKFEDVDDYEISINCGDTWLPFYQEL